MGENSVNREEKLMILKMAMVYVYHNEDSHDDCELAIRSASRAIGDVGEFFHWYHNGGRGSSVRIGSVEHVVMNSSDLIDVIETYEKEISK